jgi:hypothetical protein
MKRNSSIKPNKENSTKSVTQSHLNKKNLREGSDPITINIVKKEKPNKITDEIKNNKNILLNEEYTKNFIDFEIKIQPQPKHVNNIKIKEQNKISASSITAGNNSVYSNTSKGGNISNSKININNSSINSSSQQKDISSYFKRLEMIIIDTTNKIEMLKNEFDQVITSDQNKDNSQNITHFNQSITCNKNFDSSSSSNLNFSFLEIKTLKSELLNVKIKNEFYKLQAKFYENIFYTTKNCIENYNFISKNPSSQLENDQSYFQIEFGIKNDLKSKLNTIFSQNNKFYYENFDTKFIKEYINKENLDSYKDNKYFTSLNKIENELFSLINNLNNFSQTPIENSISDIWTSCFQIKSDIIRTLKSILSYYILNEDFNKEFKHKINFYLDNEDKLLTLETKQRVGKITKEFSEILNPHMNRVMNTKIKNELLDKVSNICSFYENFNVLLQTENKNMKNNTNLFLQTSSTKVSGITKLVDNYLIFNEENFKKINEILEISQSKNLKNLEKILLSYVRNEEGSFIDMIEKFGELKKNYFLIK